MEAGQWRYRAYLLLLFTCALFLAARLLYLFAADAERFPINTVKITAPYTHINRKQLEDILGMYLNTSFFSIPTARLENHLNQLDWSDQVLVERIWPDTLKITLVEKIPAAIWNDGLMTKDGELFSVGEIKPEENLPVLKGPAQQQLYVLQIYEKLSKLLLRYGLQANSLHLRDNQAWELFLTNGIELRLGKRDLTKRLKRFCKAYNIIFAEKSEKLSSVDLRYARGMAVQWKNK